MRAPLPYYVVQFTQNTLEAKYTSVAMFKFGGGGGGRQVSR